MSIGIPRALLYFWYGPIWEKFWQECGLQVAVSPPTDRKIMADGAQAALDEFCLPVKIFLGHVRYLAARVDWVMIPHLVKVEKDAYICPKFMGLPDVVRHTLPDLKSKILIVKVGPQSPDMGASLRRAASAHGWESPRHFEMDERIWEMALPAESSSPNIRLGILGHPYCLYDGLFNLQLLKLLTVNRVLYVTPEMMPGSFQGLGAGQLSKNLFWTIGRRQFDALEWMLRYQNVQGFIHVSAFACGLEAIIGDMLERRIKAAGIPLLKLNFEEHSGEAGFLTRLEAFLDLLQRRVFAC